MTGYALARPRHFCDPNIGNVDHSPPGKGETHTVEIQTVELLLLLLMALVLGMGFYLGQLWRKVQKLNQRQPQFVVIQSLPMETEAPAGNGCISFLFWVCTIGFISSLLALYG